MSNKILVGCALVCVLLLLPFAIWLEMAASSDFLSQEPLNSEPPDLT